MIAGGLLTIRFRGPAYALEGRPIHNLSMGGTDNIPTSIGDKWQQGPIKEEATWWLRQIASAKRIVGFDVMELSPIAGLHARDFLAAKLVYKMAGYSASRELNSSPGSDG